MIPITIVYVFPNIYSNRGLQTDTILTIITLMNVSMPKGLKAVELEVGAIYGGGAVVLVGISRWRWVSSLHGPFLTRACPMILAAH